MPEGFRNNLERHRRPGEPGAEASLYEEMFAAQAQREGVTSREVAWRHAERDNVDFDKRQSEEAQRWAESCKKVLDRLRACRDGTNEEGKEIKPLLLVLGGGMKGAYAAAQLVAFHELGLGKVFKTVVGVSAGAGSATYFVAGPEQAKHNASMYIEECTTKEFYDPARFKEAFRPKTLWRAAVSRQHPLRVTRPLDTRIISRSVREGPKALDVESIRKSEIDLYVLARPENRQVASFINMKTTPDLATAMEASTAIPLFQEPVEIEGEKYVDGALASVPIEEMIDRFKPTDILILPNKPFDYLDSFLYTPHEKFALASMGSLRSKGSLQVAQEILEIKGHTREFLEKIGKDNDCNIGVLWSTDSGLDTTTNDVPALVETAMHESYRDVYRAFGTPEPHKTGVFSATKTDGV